MVRERTVYCGFAAIVFVYVLLRAALVPIVHDEARCFELFVLTGDFLPFSSVPDAANHLTLTALAQVGYALLGDGLLALRIWSVLAFALYAYYVLKLGSTLVNRAVRVCFWSALLLMPFALDFFSLFRGYALALAFLLMAVHHAYRFAQQGGTKHLVLALLAMALASFASLSLLLMWCALLAGLLLLCVRKVVQAPRNKPALAWLGLLGALPLAYAARWSFDLREKGALYYGGADGLVNTMLASLTDLMCGTHHPALLAFVIGLFAMSLLLLWSRRSAPLPQHGLAAVCASLLCADLVGRVALNEAYDVPYPTDRTAMHLVPLFLFLVAWAMDTSATKYAWAKWTALLMLVFPLRALWSVNMHCVDYWSEQSVPEHFFRLAQERQRVMDRPIMVSGYQQMPAVWRYGNRQQGIAAYELDVADPPPATSDLLLLDPTFRTAPPGFRTIARAPSGHCELLERVEPLRTRVAVDSSFALISSGQEFLDLWKPEVAGLVGKEFFVEVGMTIAAEDRMRAALVLEVRDSDNTHRLYAPKELSYGRKGAKNRTVRMVLRLPPIQDPKSRVALYVYNVHAERFRLENGRLRIHELLH
jgi:hypothetical protein